MSYPPIPYPRKRLARGLLRGLGRLVLPLFFRLQVQGRQDFPLDGPLIVVGNHVEKQDFRLHLTPLRSYFDLAGNRPVVQTEQGDFEDWM